LCRSDFLADTLQFEAPRLVRGHHPELGLSLESQLVIRPTIRDAAMQHEKLSSMRVKTAMASVLSIMLLSAGCGPGPAQYGETTDAFVGRLVQNGKPITVPDGAKLNLTHDKTYHRFGIPLNSDGSFTIGWMPTGNYSAELIWMKQATKDNASASQQRYNVPNGLVIEKDTKQYGIELGKGWKR